MLASLLTLASTVLVLGAPAPAEDVVTISAAGHLVLGVDWPPALSMVPPDDALPIATTLAPLFADADIALANLAAPVTAIDRPAVAADGVDIFALRMPPAILPALAALGLDVVLAANNHALDFGAEGHAETLGHLARLGIGAVGHVDEVWRKDVRGARVAVLGFTQPYVPTFQSNRNLDQAAAIVARAAADADIVVVLVHGGGEGRDALHVPRVTEYVGREYRGRVVAFARRVVDAGADLVLGFGAHAPRAMEIHEGRLVAYGLGNFMTYGPFDIQSPNNLSLVLDVTLERDGRLREARIKPLRLRHPGVPFVDPLAWTVSWLRRYSRADFPTSAPDIDRDGLIRPPAAPATPTAATP